MRDYMLISFGEGNMNDLNQITKNKVLDTCDDLTIQSGSICTILVPSIYIRVKYAMIIIQKAVVNLLPFAALTFFIALGAYTLTGCGTIDVNDISNVKAETEISINDEEDQNTYEVTQDKNDVIRDEADLEKVLHVEAAPVNYNKALNNIKNITTGYFNQTSVVESENLLYKEIRMDEAAFEAFIDTGSYEASSLYEQDSEKGVLIAVAEIATEDGEVYTTIKVDAPTQNFLDITTDDAIILSSIDYIVNSDGIILDKTGNPELYTKLSTLQSEEQVEAMNAQRKDLKLLIELCGGEENAISVIRYRGDGTLTGDSYIYLYNDDFELRYNAEFNDYMFNVLKSNFEVADWSVISSLDGEVLKANNVDHSGNTKHIEILRNYYSKFEEGKKMYIGDTDYYDLLSKENIIFDYDN